MSRLTWDALKAPSAINDLERAFRTAAQEVHLFRRRVLIEPHFGYAIADPACIVDWSVPGSENTHSDATLAFYSGLPSLPKYLLARRGLLPLRRERRVISLRDAFEGTYYHTIHSVAARLEILDRHGVDKSIPIIVSGRGVSAKFFGAFSQLGELKKRNWIFQRDFYVQADEVFLSRAITVGRQQIDYFLDCAGIAEPPEGANRRLFVSRGDGVRRRLLNMSELTPVLTGFGFEVIDPAQMSIQDQIAAFQQASHVSGEHGAGLTNMVFKRGRKLHLLEILAPGMGATCYQHMCREYQYRYESIAGHDYDAYRSGFYLDRDTLSEKLGQMIGPAV